MRPAANPALRGLTAVALLAEVGLVAGWLALVYANRTAGWDPSGGLAGVVFGISATGCGVLVAHRLPGNAVGWLFIGAGLLFTMSSAAAAYALHAAVLDPGSLPGGVPVGWVGSWTWVPGFTLVSIFIGQLFPDGRPLSRRWRPVIWASVVIAVCAMLGTAIDMAGLAARSGIDHTGGPAGDPGILSTAASMAALVASLVSAVVVALRLRRSRGEARKQLEWFTYGAATAAILACTGFVVAQFAAPGNRAIGNASIMVSILALCALPVGAAVGILKYRLYDIDLVISRTLVYGALAAFITLVYVGIVVGVGALAGSGGQPNLALSIVATAVVAVAFQPVRERIQKLANRLVYGRRATPYEVLAEFSSRVAGSYAGDQVLARMARVLAEGTAAEQAEVWLRSGNILRAAATWPGSPSVGVRQVPLTGQLLPHFPQAGHAAPVRHQGELLGALTVRKRPGEALTPIEAQLLDDLAHQAGLVLKNVGLTEDLRARLDDLRASRQRLVAAQDEERRRLERNLHDGAQQHLVALKVKLGLAELLLDRDPERAVGTIEQLKSDADEALETLRDLARGIYPPLLADRGLVPALESQARKAAIAVEVLAEGVERYPQETEAAVYFFCLEALQNVQKYAAASRAEVRLRGEPDGLRVEVRDDGHGFDPGTVKRGAGLQNMEDRLASLGGTLELESTPGTGTLVRGWVPLRSAVPAG